MLILGGRAKLKGTLSYCDVVFYPLPKFLLARLQRLQFAMASFVTCKYVNSISTILDLNWLPILELRDYSLFKTIFKALYSDNWPSYLNLLLNLLGISVPVLLRGFMFHLCKAPFSIPQP